MAARELLRAQGAQMVVGMGGYVSLPAIVAARLLGLPALLHEQNAIPGLANRIGARFTPHVAVTFESSAAFFPRRCRVRVTGNPVRAGIAELDRAAVRAEALRTLDLEDRRRTLLVFGGSQGARRLNEALIRATGLWRQPGSLQIVHVCGAANLESVGRDWQEAVPGARGLSVRWFGYVDRMDLAYSAADLVVSRSGATTVSEVSAVGLPAILVPYPFATANHQEANARALESVGAARVLADSEVDADRLVEEVERVLGDEALLASMSVASRAWGRPHAAEALAGYVEEIAFAGGRQKG
jgi:UDP-N-acetylglucosamine--N-acetylmuramyl-(pentapeptide) pyrophosphoryl-undecaprenol N-acetylglucosamine transferase